MGLLVFSGCAHKETQPYLGKWNGGFVTDQKRDSLIGFLQIYATQNKFVLHLTGEQQTVDATGNWTAKVDRLYLKVVDVQIDDAGGEQKRDLSKRYIPADDLRAAYHGTLIMELSQDKLSLKGLETSVGSLIGHHEFKKVTNTYTY